MRHEGPFFYLSPKKRHEGQLKQMREVPENLFFFWPKLRCTCNSYYMYIDNLIFFQMHWALFFRQSRGDIHVVSVIRYYHPRLMWYRMRESILERNLTVVRSVGNHFQRKAV